MGDRGIQWDTGGYRGLQGETEVYKERQMDTGGDRRLQGSEGKQGETEGGRWIQRETGEIEGDRGYRGIQYTNDMLTQHIS